MGKKITKIKKQIILISIIFFVLFIFTSTAYADRSFTDLNTTINNNTTIDNITLNQNYTYNSSSDENFTNGILINRTITIDGNGTTINGNNIARIFQIGTNGTVILKNIILINGNNTNGGAIYNEGSLTISNSRFENNNASNGSVIYNNNTNKTNIKSSIILNNTGQVIYNNNSTTIANENWWGSNTAPIIDNTTINNHYIFNLTIDNTTITNTTSALLTATLKLNTTNATWNGQDIYVTFTSDKGAFSVNNGKLVNGSIETTFTPVNTNDSAEVTAEILGFEEKIENITANNKINNITVSTLTELINAINGNRTDTIIINENILFNETITITRNLTIYGNKKTLTSNQGFFNINNTITVNLENIIFSNSNNTSAINNTGNLKIYGSTFQNNNATTGGAIYNTGTITIAQTTFKNNTATQGGAIYNLGNLTINLSHFTNNNATENGTAIYNQALEPNTITIRTTKFTNDNTSNITIQIYSLNTNVSAENNIGINSISENVTGTNITWNYNLYVSNNGSKYNSGLEDSPLQTISNAVEQIDSGKTIYLANGIYDEDTIIINKNVNIIGEDKYNTIISPYSGYIFSFSASNVRLTIKNMMLTNATNGAIFAQFGSLTAENVIFKNNKGNAAIYIGTLGLSVGNTHIINNCIFENNAAGSICVIASSELTVTNSIFRNNIGVNGAAIRMDSGKLIITGSTFYNNKASALGGAIAITGTTTTIKNSVFRSNTATTANGGGGAIFNNGSLTITGSTFQSNNALYKNGVYYGKDIYSVIGKVILTNNNFKGTTQYLILVTKGSLNAKSNTWALGYPGLMIGTVKGVSVSVDYGRDYKSQSFTTLLTSTTRSGVAYLTITTKKGSSILPYTRFAVKFGSKTYYYLTNAKGQWRVKFQGLRYSSTYKAKITLVSNKKYKYAYLKSGSDLYISKVKRSGNYYRITIKNKGLRKSGTTYVKVYFTKNGKTYTKAVKVKGISRGSSRTVRVKFWSYSTHRKYYKYAWVNYKPNTVESNYNNNKKKFK